jgi:predicted nucleic acid-binding protein
MEYLLDSVILIDHMNQIPEATAYLIETKGRTAISVITRAEILTGIDPSSQKVVVDFLECFPLFEITKPIADIAAEMRRKNGWKLPDAFQAALAKYHHLKLVTRNTRDFSPVKHDFIVIPYSK